MTNSERVLAQARANELVNAIVPSVQAVDGEIKPEDCLACHALEITAKQLSAIVIRLLVEKCGAKTPGGGKILSAHDLLAIADVLEGSNE